jgi:hypothetical protein
VSAYIVLLPNSHENCFLLPNKSAKFSELTTLAQAPNPHVVLRSITFHKWLKVSGEQGLIIDAKFQ